MNGVLVIDKPRGWTSHDAVAKVKRTLAAKKVGHLGTLDPMASGVLPLVIDGATKFARYLEGRKKSYAAELKLGEATDTYDAEGEVVRRSEVRVSAEEISDAFAAFTGRIKQEPPMYSSVKLHGTPLYRLARKGVTVERSPKEVEVYEIRVTRVSLPYVLFGVLCSKGTYVRTLCHDAGESLGCGGHLSWLRRTQSGCFTIDEAVTPELPGEVLLDQLLPLEDALLRASGELRSIPVDAAATSRIREKRPFLFSGWRELCPALSRGEPVRFTEDSNKILALGEYTGHDMFSVRKVFPHEGERAYS